MNVLLIVPRSASSDHFREAWESEGHAVEYIDERGLRRWPVFWRVVRQSPPLRRISNALLGRYIVSVARRMRPDLVLICKGTTIKIPTLRRLRALGLKVANWFPENGNNEPYRSWLTRMIPEYDYFFSFDSAILERQAEFPNTILAWLPFGAVSSAVDVSDEERGRYDADICFVGAPYPERVALLSLLMGRRLKIFGWEGWKNTPLAAQYHGPLSASEAAKAYRCAKICVNTNLEPPTAGVNMKTFEIPAAGGFQLSDWRKDVEHVFEVGKEIEVFRTDAEFVAKIDHYLAHDAQRSAVAEAGYQRVLKDHALVKRIRAVVAAIT